MKQTRTILLGIFVLTVISLIYLFVNNQNLKTDLIRAESISINYEGQISGMNKTIENISEQYVLCSELVENLQNNLNREAVLKKYKEEMEEENHNRNLYKVLANIKLRQNPDENSTIIKEIRLNEIVNLMVSGFEDNYKKNNYPNEWWKVKFKNKVGWVIAKYYYTDLFGDGQRKLEENLLFIK